MRALLLAASDAPPPVVFSDAWWSLFTTSAAFAGLMALVAAWLAWRGVKGRIKADQKMASEERTAVAGAAKLARDQALEDAKAERWWQMYQWTLSQIAVLDADRVTTLLEELDTQAPGDAERALVSVAGDLIVPATVEGGGDDGE